MKKLQTNAIQDHFTRLIGKLATAIDRDKRRTSRQFENDDPT